MSKEPCFVYQMHSSDVKCYWSDGLVKIALLDNILYTINKFYFDIDFSVMHSFFFPLVYIKVWNNRQNTNRESSLRLDILQ